MDNNEALHEAISNKDMKTFLDLIHQPGIDLNYRNDAGDTPLIASIEKGEDTMAKYLIEAGCDVNIAGWYGRSPLLVTIRLSRVMPNYDVKFLQMLIQAGANINLQERWNRVSPLHYAVSKYNSEAATMLPYYEDVQVRATEVNSSFVFELVESGADVNCVDESGFCLLHKTLDHKNADIFKFLWSKINHNLLIDIDTGIPPFLYRYIHWQEFSNHEYLECLYLMLDSPIAQFLIEDSINRPMRRNVGFVQNLFEALAKRKIPPNDRLSLIYICQSLSVEVNIDDLQGVYRLYGFNDEFKALLYTGNVMCYDYVEEISYCLGRDFYLKGFSSVSHENKRHLLMQLQRYGNIAEYKEMEAAFGRLPEYASLLELSRNQAQEFIHENFYITKLYQFYDVVKSLKLPQHLKDVILLEKPIYT